MKYHKILTRPCEGSLEFYCKALTGLQELQPIRQHLLQVRDLGEPATEVHEIQLALSAEAYLISAELRMPPPAPVLPSPRRKPESPRAPLPSSPKGVRPPVPSSPAETGDRLAQAKKVAVPAPSSPSETRDRPAQSAKTGTVPVANSPAQITDHMVQPHAAATPRDPNGLLLDFGVLRVRDAGCRTFVLANTGRHAVGFAFSARTQACTCSWDGLLCPADHL